MDARPDDAVLVAGDDDAGRRDLVIAFGLRREMGFQARDVLAIGPKTPRSHGARRPAAARIIGWWNLGCEDSGDAGFEAERASDRHDEGGEEMPNHGCGGEAITPVDPARPGMARRRDEDEASHEGRLLERERRSDGSPKGMADDDRFLDAGGLESARDQLCLAARRGVGPTQAVAPALARTIDGENAVAPRERAAKREELV